MELGWKVTWLPEVEPALTAWISNAGTAALRLQLFPDAISARLEAVPVPFSSYRLLVMPHPLGDIRGNDKAGHKGLLGAWDSQTRNHAEENFADDALLLWPDGTLAETAIASICLQVNDQLLLPPTEGRVASITEAVDLPPWAASLSLCIRRGPIALEEVSSGRLWCMNAVRGLWQAEVVQL